MGLLLVRRRRLLLGPLHLHAAVACSCGCRPRII